MWLWLLVDCPSAVVKILDYCRVIRGTTMEEKGNILVVDDDPAMLQFLRTILQHEGYVVDVAANGAQAFAKVHETCPDLILLDINMPLIDGWTFLQIAQEIDTCDPPIIAMSVEWRFQSVSLVTGVCDFIPKPLDLDTLLNCVKTNLQGTASSP
jgi:DNA-binding response OmpR family regulator